MKLLLFLCKLQNENKDEWFPGAGPGGGGGGFIHLVLHKKLEYKAEKLKNKKVGGHAAKDQNQIRTSIGK